MQIRDHAARVADELEIEMSVEELDEILALTPSIPIPPPLR